MENAGESSTAGMADPAVATRSEDSGQSTMDVDIVTPNAADAHPDITGNKSDVTNVKPDTTDVKPGPLV